MPPYCSVLKHPMLNRVNPSCKKVFGTHIFYEGGLSYPPPPPRDFGNGRLYNLKLWQAIRTIYER